MVSLSANMYRLILQWCHNEHGGVSNHQLRDCLLNHLFRPRSKESSKLRVTGLCAWNSPVTGEFPTQMASNAENVSISWRHHEIVVSHVVICPYANIYECNYVIIFTEESFLSTCNAHSFWYLVDEIVRNYHSCTVGMNVDFNMNN